MWRLGAWIASAQTFSLICAFLITLRPILSMRIAPCLSAHLRLSLISWGLGTPVGHDGFQAGLHRHGAELRKMG
jgi:hypothetical protein